MILGKKRVRLMLFSSLVSRYPDFLLKNEPVTGVKSGKKAKL